ncbi:hypothetical protein PENPOL_c005G07880 [Penicillium polonicum]|uniref:Protein kinase domain-containing protein n=1 Tax=Penicillium polonicum TaxID=60169 RepID=A0A1V6NMK1_PENPO|nr:hypothetical protein PENPOL_c005G07880 [Penicillium polonicum]
MELMQIDLQTLLKAKPIESEVFQFFLYQIIRSMKYIHSASAIHRDRWGGRPGGEIFVF